MPLLYVAVGQRLGYPIAMVHVPDHGFARYVDPHFPNGNIEATSGGKRFFDHEYIEKHGVNAKALQSGAYMRPLSLREHLGMLITANAFLHALHKDVAKCLDYLKASLLLAPRRAETYEQIAAGYEYYSKLSSGAESKAYAAQAKATMQKALDLGYVRIEDVRKNRNTEGLVGR